MPDSEPLSPTTWDGKYHVVFIPTYRRQALDHALRRHLGDVLRAVAEQKDCRSAAGHLLGDHGPRLLAMPLQYSVAHGVGFIKGKAAIHMAQTCMGRRQNSTGHHGWARGAYVSTVGRNETVSRAYSRTQAAEERRLDQTNLW
jgi:putative transposase